MYSPFPLGVPEVSNDMSLIEGWSDPRDIVTMFEERIAKFYGSKYAVSTDCCSHAIFLSLKYIQNLSLKSDLTITIPKHTYISVPMQIKHAGFNVNFADIEWKGYYNLYPTCIYDAAVIWEEGSYIKNSLMCLSFQIKKALGISRGGMILTNSIEAYRWLKLASYDGRDLTLPYDHPNHFTGMGYHYYMTPEIASKGLLLMDKVKTFGRYLGNENYPDISKVKYE